MSAPSAMAAPTRNSRLRSLLPPNASGSRSSRLIQTSTSAAEALGERRQRLQRRRLVEEREAGTAGSGGRWHAAMVRARIIGPMATRITPADRLTTVGQHAGMERSIAISAPLVGSRPALLVDRVDRAWRPDPHPPPRRMRDVDLHPVRTRPLHVGSDRPRARRSTPAAGDFIYIPAGEVHVEENASADRAARRGPDPQLPRFARRVPRRRAGRLARRPRSVLSAASIA